MLLSLLTAEVLSVPDLLCALVTGVCCLFFPASLEPLKHSIEFHSKLPSISIIDLLGSEPCMCQISKWAMIACASDACLPVGSWPCMRQITRAMNACASGACLPVGSQPCMCQITRAMNACASDACWPAGRRKAPAPAFGDKSAPAAAAHTQTVPDFFTGMHCTALHLMQHPCLLSASCWDVAALRAKQHVCSLIADANEAGNLLQAMQSERAMQTGQTLIQI